MKLPALLLLTLCLHHGVAQTQNTGAALAAAGGRFVFGQTTQARRDQYMLDTQTGRLWQMVEDTNKLMVLQPVFYSTLDDRTTLAPEDAQTEQAKADKLWLMDDLRDASNTVIWLKANPQGGVLERRSGPVQFTAEQVKDALPRAEARFTKARNRYFDQYPAPAPAVPPWEDFIKTFTNSQPLKLEPVEPKKP